MKAVILAGGEGTRLRPLTATVPKVMLPVLNVPFLEHILQYLKCYQIQDIILATGYLPQAIQSYFGDGSRWGVRLSYRVETTPLGTAGAVKNIASLLSETFLVFNGDTFTDLDLSVLVAFHRERQAKGTIALTPVEDPSRFGVVETDTQGRIRAFKEKPRRDAITTRNINAGIYVLEPQVLDYVPQRHFMFEQGLFPLLIDQGEPLFGFVFSGYFLDMGTPATYLKLNHDLLLQQGKNQSRGCHIHPTAQVEGLVMLGEGSILGPRARVRGPVVLGPGCQIGEGALIEGSIVWRGVKIGEGVILKNSIVASNCFIGKHCWLTEGCVVGEGANIGENNRLSQEARVGAGERLEPRALYL